MIASDEYLPVVRSAFSGEFAVGCVTGAIHGSAKGDAVEFTWSGNDEMEEACGDGWAELQPDGTVEGQILHPWW